MTARHMRKAVIQSRRQALRPHENFGEAMVAQVAIGLTEDEVLALADHHRRHRPVFHPDLRGAVQAILAAADDIRGAER